MRLDTIAAISTPQGRGGIGIIRISGPLALSIASKVLKTKINLTSLQSSDSRHFIHGYFLDEGRVLDEVLVACMPSCKSFTGEPTVEINCHGGRAILASAMEAIVSSGARPADPGEFTRRAFLNGKLDLIQAEAINDMINARTKKGVQAAWKHLEGGLSQQCQALREQLVRIFSEIQASIDFDVLESREWEKNISSMIETMEQMLKASSGSKFIQQGCWIALTGLPNSGKSSIFNSMLHYDRSIVCDIPGTTRDHITETIEIEGIEVRLTDTAGIRETSDLIEKTSIERSLQQVDAADIVIYVVDQSQILDKPQIDHIRERQGKQILVFNKSDLPAHPSVEIFVGTNQDFAGIHVSALTKDGIDELMDHLSEMVVALTPDIENPVVTNLRQTKLMTEAKTSLHLARTMIAGKRELDLVSDEIQHSIKSLEEIIGIVEDDMILDQIFSKFCIGK